MTRSTRACFTLNVYTLFTSFTTRILTSHTEQFWWKKKSATRQSLLCLALLECTHYTFTLVFVGNFHFLSTLVERLGAAVWKITRRRDSFAERVSNLNFLLIRFDGKVTIATAAARRRVELDNCSFSLVDYFIRDGSRKRVSVVCISLFQLRYELSSLRAFAPFRPPHQMGFSHAQKRSVFLPFFHPVSFFIDSHSLAASFTLE